MAKAKAKIEDMVDLERLEQQKYNILNFMEKYMKYYGIGPTLNMIAFLETHDKKTLTGSTTQILSKFKILKPPFDRYVTVAQWLKELNFLQGNCCEIGSGIYPRLGELVAKEIELSKRHLTLYDPKSIDINLPNTTIYQKAFDQHDNLNDIDTLYALNPCEATIITIDRAIEENKNLFLAFCACDNSTKEHSWDFGDYWAEDVCSEYREKYGPEIQITTWKDPYRDLPIMIRKKRK